MTMNDSEIIDAFSRPEFYDHSVDHIELIETHISWVFLTGHLAYKIKKPVNFGFLDFTALEQRKYYCHQELILNKRFAPDIYLEVVPITLSEKKLSLNSQGEVVEYAIKMQQFDQSCLFDKLLKKHHIEQHDIDDLSSEVAEFHNKINVADVDDVDDDFGSIKTVIDPIEDNFSILSNILENTPSGTLANGQEQKKLNNLHQKILTIYQSIQALLIVRKKENHIRECHGDLHLGNIAIVNNKVLLFDGIEFNDTFRWIDTMSDCAFVIMDLEDHNQSIFAQHFLNTYLLKTGDYSGLQVLNFYKFYRATVRAKVSGLRLQQQFPKSIEYKKSVGDLINYLDLAESYLSSQTQSKNTFLAINYGISGSGKSWISSKIADQIGAIQLSSDYERKRLFVKNSKELYSDAVTQKTYTRLMKLCETVLNSGYPVIIDATFLDKKWRQKFQMIAEKQKIPFHILSYQAQHNTIIQRIKLRQNDSNQISDADLSVMKQQLIKMDKLDIGEKKYEILIDTEQPFSETLITLTCNALNFI